MPKVVRFWLPGGNLSTISMKTALALVPNLLIIDDYLWEERLPGIDCEQTWGDSVNQYAHKTLRDAVLSAFPDHAHYGLTLTEAAVLCMDKGLVVSTGATKPYWPNEE